MTRVFVLLVIVLTALNVSTEAYTIRSVVADRGDPTSRMIRACVSYLFQASDGHKWRASLEHSEDEWEELTGALSFRVHTLPGSGAARDILDLIVGGERQDWSDTADGESFTLLGFSRALGSYHVGPW